MNFCYFFFLFCSRLTKRSPFVCIKMSELAQKTHKIRFIAIQSGVILVAQRVVNRNKVFSCRAQLPLMKITKRKRGVQIKDKNQWLWYRCLFSLYNSQHICLDWSWIARAEAVLNFCSVDVQREGNWAPVLQTTRRSGGRPTTSSSLPPPP